MNNNNNSKGEHVEKEVIDKKNLHKARGIAKVSGAVKKKINYSLQMTGFLFFTGIFVILIPILLYKMKKYTILEGYLPNVDLIATALSWHGGPFNSWQELYPASPVTNYGFISQVFINYIALLGLTYIIAREASITRNAIKGWSMGFVMLLMTYLLPSNATIIPFMDYANMKLSGIKAISSTYQNEIIACLGLMMAGTIIYLESQILKYFHHHLYKIGHIIINIPKLF